MKHRVRSVYFVLKLDRHSVKMLLNPRMMDKRKVLNTAFITPNTVTTFDRTMLKAFPLRAVLAWASRQRIRGLHLLAHSSHCSDLMNLKFISQYRRSTIISVPERVSRESIHSRRVRTSSIFPLLNDTQKLKWFTAISGIFNSAPRIP